MPREVIKRSASDNEYLHKDFHGALSVGLDYIATHFGEDAVGDYLREFALSYYAPLKKDLVDRGLVAVKEHFFKVYNEESAEFEVSFDEDELRIEVAACPAVMHMREKNYTVSPWFIETTRTINHAICEGTPFAFELVEYDEPTGKSVQRFYRRSK